MLSTLKLQQRPWWIRKSSLAAVAGLCALAAGVMLGGRAAHAQLPPPTAQDTASDAAYDPPTPQWTTGDNGGFGMGAWTLTPASSGPTAGHFVGNSTGNGSGVDSNGDGDINTPVNRAWGLYANSGQTSEAVRNFNDPFTPGSVFEIWMDNGNVQVGGTVGFALRNASGQELLEVYFIGGGTQYTVHGDTPIPSGVAFTHEGVRVVITLTTSSTFQATLTRLVDGASNTVSGSLRNNPGPISRLRLFNANAGSGSGFDLFFNRITYYRGRVLNADTGRGYLNIQPAIDDPATQPGHTLVVAAGTYTGTQNNPVTISKPRLTLVGAGPAATLISRTVAGPASGIVINGGITGTTISGLRVQGFNVGGICGVAGNHFTTITNTHVFSNTGGSGCLGGIYLNGPVQHVTVSHSEAAYNTSRGIVIWNGFKTNITFTHNYVHHNNCCGIELQDGTASGVLIAHNLVRDNADNGIGVVGLTSGAGPNLIYSNTLYNNGRFGIEVKLPDGSGLTSGDGSIVVLSNTVELTDTISAIKPGELRDLAGIAAFRRGWVAGEGNVDIPTGVVIQGNTVRGYVQNASGSNSEGFGIVVEGANMTVVGNTIEDNEVGLQGQAGHTPYAPFTNLDGDQTNLADQFFGRGNSPQLCGYTFSGNTFNNNGTDTRILNATGGVVTNLNAQRVACTIQAAIDAPTTLNGHVLSLSANTFTETVIVRKAVAIVGGGPGQSVIQSLSPGIVVTQSNVTISNTSIVGTGADIGITTTFGVTGLTVSNVHISNFAQGVGLLGGHSHVVQNSVFTLTNVITSVGVGMNGGGLATPITNVLVSGNVFTSSGYAVVGIFASQNQIVGNVMRNGIAGVRMAGANNNVVAGNQIENNASYAIYFAPDAPPLISSPSLNNNGNLISGNVALNHPADRGIQIINATSPGSGNQIVNNTVQNVGGQAIFIGAGSGDTNLVVSGNIVTNVLAGVPSVFIAPATDVTVTGNVISNGLGIGIRVGGGSNFLVQANRVLSHSAGISASALSGVRIDANEIIGYQQYGAAVTSAGGLIELTDNFVDAQGGQQGFRFALVGDVSVVSNTIQGHAQHAVTATNMAVLSVVSNTITNGSGSSGVTALSLGGLQALTNTITGGDQAILLDSAGDSLIAGNVVSGAAQAISVRYVGSTVVTSNTLSNNGVGLTFENGPSNLLTATLNLFTANITGVQYLGNQPGLNVYRNAIAGNTYGIENASSPVVLAECNWYGAASGPSGAGPGSGDSVSTGVDFNPWLLDSDLNGPCAGGTLIVQKVVSGPIAPVTSWQFTATVPTGTLVFTLPASGGSISFSGLDFGSAFITETTKLGYTATSACSTGATGGSAIGLALAGTVTCTFTNTINPVTTVITVTPAITNGWAYITETVGPGVFPVPFDIVLPPPAPTLGEASARMVITDVNWRHMYLSPIFTGTLLSDITAFEYRFQRPSVDGQWPYINIGWDDDVTDSNTGFRGRLVYIRAGLPLDTWNIVDARNDPTPRWYTTLITATQCTSSSPCTFVQLVAAYPNAAIHPGTLMGVPLGFVGLRAGGMGTTGTTYVDGLLVGVGGQITLYDFEAAPPTTVTLAANPTTTVVGSSALLTATVQIGTGDPAADGTVVSFTTSLGSILPVTATTVGGVATATISSTTAGVATVTATVGSLNATAQVTFTPGAPFTLTLTATPTTLAVGNSSALTATVTDQYGNPVADGTTVSFATTLGALGSATANTTGGSAVNSLSSTTAGVATVTATVGSLNATAQVTFTPGAPFTLTLTAVPTTLAVGNSSTLTATVTDQYGNPVADGTTVSFATTLGTLGSPTANTTGGNAINSLSSTTAGVATVTATVGSLNATAQVTFTPGTPFTVSLTLSPTIIFANGISQSVAVATVTDQYGNPVPGVTVQFLAGIGVFTPNSGSTGANGSVTVALTSLIPAIENVFAVVSGVGFAPAQATYVNLPAAIAPLTGTLGTVTQTLDVVRKGDLITYTIKVTNTGAGQINNVLIFGPIPSGTTYVAGSASGGNYSGSSMMLLSGEVAPASVRGPRAVLNAVTWAGNLPSGASHTLSYVVQVQILEGQVVNQPKIFVDNADTGIDLSSTVDVVARKYYLPIVQR